MRRNIALLASCQALMLSGSSLLAATSALVGLALATDESLATVPLAIQLATTMLTSIPAALLMDRIGRKPGFLIATGLGISGGLTAALAIVTANFWLFAAGTALCGAYNGFGTYYRFAAADAVPDEDKSTAVSLVLAGGVVAAFVGPNVATWTKGLVASAPFAGCYGSLAGFYLLTLATLLFVRFPSHSSAPIPELRLRGRPLATIAAQPKLLAAVVCGMFGYATMTLVMTAMPLAMHRQAHSFADTSFVIQWHVLGMFAPSFVTGRLIRRFGILSVMAAGVVLDLACVTINLTGTELWHFWAALVALGVGWNFLFIGATTLLTQTYRPEERGKVQAANDFAVFSTVTAASLSAGAIHHHLGWRMVNVGVLPMLVLVAVSLVWVARGRAVGATPASPGR